MPQVIIVSNRLPVSVKKEGGKLVYSPSVGGLATGLSSYVKDKDSLWIGWPGIPSDDLKEAEKQAITQELARHNCAPVFLSRRQIDAFYNGYSNAILWPLFHNLKFDYGNPEGHKRWWRAYRRVNNMFAEAVLNVAQLDSRIWVHDYQLLLLPGLLREELPAASIGFFLHIPFPDTKTFQSLPESRKLLLGIAGADLVGFHTTGYVDNFVANCRAAGLTVTEQGQLLIAQRLVRVANFPMGIDYQRYASAGRTKAVKEAVKRFKSRYKGLKVIAAVDRMDPSKGLVERLKAYEQLLEQYSHLRGKVVFALIAAPSRTDIPAYKQLSQRLGKLVQRINLRYGSPRWQPVDYMNQTKPFEEVTALFQVADVAFIVPLRDGMNLAAKEFVATKRGAGVLVLSETAGAAEELKDALLVNPRRPETLVAGLYQALNMPNSELKSRLSSMQKQLSSHTVHTWARTFVKTLQQPVPGTGPSTKTLNDKVTAQLCQDYLRAKKRLLLLDYDGSLVPFSHHFSKAKPTATLTRLLSALGEDKRNTVIVVSGRSAGDLQQWLGHLPVGLIGEHGATTKKPGGKQWHRVHETADGWQEAVLPAMLRYTRRTPEATLETKAHSIVWHYRASPPYHAQKYSVTIKRALKPILNQYGLHIFQGDKILEIKDPHVTKGAAIQPWLSGNYDFVLILGDDYTDEDMFTVAHPSNYTVKVGRGRTRARYRVPEQAEVARLLRKLTK